MIRRAIHGVAILGALVLAGGARADADARRGGEIYRACVSCHSLEPSVHLTGPSLAGLWGRAAGRVDGFARYSAGLRSAAFDWDATTLDAWLADPGAMIPDTRMVFRGIAAEQDRADLVAFLALAMAPGGARTVVEQSLVPAGWARGQKPEPLTPTPPEARVTRLRHCHDSYLVTTADGAGMMGDRVSIVFASLQDLNRLVEEAC